MFKWVDLDEYSFWDSAERWKQTNFNSLPLSLDNPNESCIYPTLISRTDLQVNYFDPLQITKSYVAMVEIQDSSETCSFIGNTYYYQ